MAKLKSRMQFVLILATGEYDLNDSDLFPISILPAIPPAPNEMNRALGHLCAHIG